MADVDIDGLHVETKLDTSTITGTQRNTAHDYPPLQRALSQLTVLVACQKEFDRLIENALDIREDPKLVRP